MPDPDDRSFHFYDMQTLTRTKTIVPAGGGANPNLTIEDYSGRRELPRFAVVVKRVDPGTANQTERRTWTLYVYDADGNRLDDQTKVLVRQEGSSSSQLNYLGMPVGSGYVIYEVETGGLDDKVRYSWGFGRIDKQDDETITGAWRYSKFGYVQQTLFANEFSLWRNNRMIWKADFTAAGSNVESNVEWFASSSNPYAVGTSQNYLVFFRFRELADSDKTLDSEVLVVDPADGRIVSTIPYLTAEEIDRDRDGGLFHLAAGNRATVLHSSDDAKDATYDLVTGRPIWSGYMPSDRIVTVSDGDLNSDDDPGIAGLSGTDILLLKAGPYGTFVNVTDGSVTYAPKKKKSGKTYPGEWIYGAGGWFFTSKQEKLIRYDGVVKD